MQLINNKNIKILAGSKNFKKRIFNIFDSEVCNFLETLSFQILKDKNAMKYSDLISFGFLDKREKFEKKK